MKFGITQMYRIPVLNKTIRSLIGFWACFNKLWFVLMGHWACFKKKSFMGFDKPSQACLYELEPSLRSAPQAHDELEH